MEAEVGVAANSGRAKQKGGDQVRLRKETLQAVLDQCQQALQSLQHDHHHHQHHCHDDDDSSSDSETTELCNLLKFRVESPNFLEKLGSVHVSASQNVPGFQVYGNGLFSGGSKNSP